MRRGFTLLELMVVIIILGVLATLGVMQYQSAIEKSRGAEARQVIGQLRSACAAIFMRDGDTTNCDDGNLGILSGGGIPPTTGGCEGTHFFSYEAASGGSAAVTFTATRCTGGGKTPNATVANTLVLTTDFSSGQDDWSSTGSY